MKTNVPEKIYISTNSQDGTYYISNQYKRLIEYTLTNAFIEKAVVWISNNCYIPHSTLEDFKNYMKGE